MAARISGIKGHDDHGAAGSGDGLPAGAVQGEGVSEHTDRGARSCAPGRPAAHKSGHKSGHGRPRLRPGTGMLVVGRRCAALAMSRCVMACAQVRVQAAAAVTLLQRTQASWSRALMRAGGQRPGLPGEAIAIPSFEEAAEMARKEWVRAASYFDQVVDPDLIDYATFSLRAAERKYVYLLKKAREESALASHTTAG